MTQRLAFFDLDNCLVTCNMSELLLKGMLRKGMLPAAARNMSVLVKAAEALEREPKLEELFRLAYAACAGIPLPVVEAIGEAVVAKGLDLVLRPEMVRLLEWHREQGDVPVLLSCSTEHVVRHVASRLGFRHFHGLMQEVVDGHFSGRISGIFSGVQKAKRIVELSRELGLPLEEAFFYTDSFDDEVALRLVGRPRAAYPDAGLSHVAKQRRWPVIRDARSAVRATRPTVLILSAMSGNGHVTNAEAIAGGLNQALRDADGHPRYNIETINLEDDSVIARYMSSFYNYLAKHHPQLYSLYHQVLNDAHGVQGEAVSTVLRLFCEQLHARHRPAAIITVHGIGAELSPFFKEIAPDVPFFTCVGDWFGNCLLGWGNKGADVIYAPSERNAEYLIQAGGARRDQVVVGSPVYPARFDASRISPGSIAEVREALGLSAERSTVLFHSHGSTALLPLLERMTNLILPVQLIVLCNRSSEVFEEVSALSRRSLLRIVPILFADDIEPLLRASDYVFAKPGTTTVVEALAMQRAFLINQTATTMPQEQEVAEFLLKNELAVGVRSVDDWVSTVKAMAVQDSPERRIREQARAFRLPNGLGPFCEIVQRKLESTRVRGSQAST